jgi:hypothetical protein
MSRATLSRSDVLKDGTLWDHQVSLENHDVDPHVVDRARILLTY